MGLDLGEAARMASLYPAEAMGIDAEYGHLRPGARANFIHLSNSRQLHSTWIGGAEVWRA
jgi:N-acetylglucosamine-6-phosphate deacetylase